MNKYSGLRMKFPVVASYTVSRMTVSETVFWIASLV